MFGIVFRDTLRHTSRLIAFIGGGLGFMGLFMVLILPDATGLQQMTDFFSTIPPIILAAAGVGDNLPLLATPEGFIAMGLFSKFLLFFAAYSVIIGLDVTANEEDEGTLDVVLSWPVPRWQIIAEKFAAYTVSILLITAPMFVGIWLGTYFTDITLNLGTMAQLVATLFPAMTLVLAFTVLIGAFIGRKRWVVFITTSFVIGSFMLQTVGAVAKGSIAENVRYISFFSYVDVGEVVAKGLSIANVAGLLAISIVMIIAAMWAFERRDIGV